MFSIKKAVLIATASLASIQSVFAYQNYENCVVPGVVALTFDDGPTLGKTGRPDTEYTRMVLDVLKKENVKATFFVNGNNCVDVANSPEAQALIKREFDEGHIVASHTYTHPDNITSLTDEQLTYELKTLNDILYGIIGVKPAFFRPPLGVYNEQNRVILEAQGFTANVLWSIDSNDWQYQNVTANYLEILDKANPATDSFIALNHDINNVTATYNVAHIIPLVRERGFKFVTLDECLGMTAYQGVDSLASKQAATATTTTLKIAPTLNSNDMSNLQRSDATSTTKTISLISAMALISLTLLNFL